MCPFCPSDSSLKRNCTKATCYLDVRCLIIAIYSLLINVHHERQVTLIMVYSLKRVKMAKIDFKWEKKGPEWYCMIPSVQQNEVGRYRLDRSEFVCISNLHIHRHLLKVMLMKVISSFRLGMASCKLSFSLDTFLYCLTCLQQAILPFNNSH